MDTLPEKDENATAGAGAPAGSTGPGSGSTGLPPWDDSSGDIEELLGVRDGGPRLPGYEVIGPLGRGAMGAVYQARQVNAGRLVALKVIIPGAVPGGDARQRFRTEAEAMARLVHPNVVPVYDVGEHDGVPYFSMEYCPGGTLAGRLAGGPLSPRGAAELVRRVALGVQAAHERHIVHRDLKPGNVLLGENGEPKVADFGLAKKLDEGSELTQSETPMGTPAYMAPEQAAGRSKEAGPPADVYALGALLYHCLTGRPPFLGATVYETIQQVVDAEPVPARRLQPKCPRDLETVSQKCLSKSPAGRYGSAAAVADDLRRFLNGESILARPAGPARRSWRWAKRRPAVAGLLAVLALVLAVGAAAVTWKWREAERNFQESERNFLRAGRLVDDFFTDVSESELLDEPGMQPLREKLLRRAMRHYRAFLAERAGDPMLKYELALARVRLGSILGNLGRRGESIALLKEGRDGLRSLAEASPGGSQYRADLARAEFNFSHSLETEGGLPAALAAAERSLEIRRGLTEARPGDAALSRDVARSCLRVAALRGRLGRAGDRLRLTGEAVGLLEPLAEKRPEGAAAALSDLVTAYIMFARNRPHAEADAACRKAVAIAEKLVALAPRSVNRRRSLAQAHSERGLVNRRHDAKASYESLRRAADVWEVLSAENPADVSMRRKLGAALDQAAFALHQLDKSDPKGLAEALKLYRRAESIYAKLLAAGPTPATENFMAMILNGIALVQRDLALVGGKPELTEECLRTFRRAMAAQRRLAGRFPDRPRHRMDWAGTNHNMGRVYQANKRWPEAAAAFRESARVNKPLIERFPGLAFARQLQGDNYTALGSALIEQGDRGAAAAALTRAENLWAELAEADPKMSYFKSQLGACRDELRKLRGGPGRKDGKDDDG